MATIIEFRIPLEQVALSHTATAVPTVSVEIERCVAQATDSMVPFVWIRAGDFGAFERALLEDPSVVGFSMLADVGKERFYRMHWSTGVADILEPLLKGDGAIITASMNGDSWEIQLMCPERSSLSDIYEFCEANDLSLTVDAIYDLSDHEGAHYGLTEAQHMTLLQAKEKGYYDVPRTVTLSELSNELDLSHQALSERLRRAHGSLIDRTVSSANKTQTERLSALE